MGVKYENGLRELMKTLKKKKSAVFCGAGISFNSGLPIVLSILDYIFSKLELTVEQVKLINNSALPFESIMEMILGESGLEEIQEIFSAGTPNANHTLIAKLAKEGFVKIICTTNFDVLIEKALENQGLETNEDFKVYSSEADFDSISWDAPIVKVIKIHGCATKKAEMAITMSQIASDKYSAMRKNLLHEIFCTRQCDNTVVLGYSCSDLDLTPLVESMDGEKSDIFFIEHQASLRNEDLQPVSIKRDKNPFRNYTGLRIIANTDKLVKDIWHSLIDQEYLNSPIPGTEWKNNIDIWYFTAVKESGTGVKHHIAARLLYAIGEFEEAIVHNREAIVIALKNDNLLAYSSEVGNMGMAFNCIGDYEQAKFCLAESIPLCKRLKNLQGLSAQLQTYGNILHHTGDDVNALQYHKKALLYAESEKDDFAISNILGNMSNSYNRLGQLDNAISSLNKALTLSRKLGNKQAESSQLGIMANTYLQMGKYSDVLDCCLTGIEIKRTLGDRHGECLMLANLISVYRIAERPQEAMQTAQDCISLAREISNKQAEAIAVMNIALL